MVICYCSRRKLVQPRVGPSYATSFQKAQIMLGLHPFYWAPTVRQTPGLQTPGTRLLLKQAQAWSRKQKRHVSTEDAQDTTVPECHRARSCDNAA